MEVLEVVSDAALPVPLKDGKRFLLDVGPHGFRAYNGQDNWDLFASSSSMLTFTRMMSDIVRVGCGHKIEFQTTTKENEIRAELHKAQEEVRYLLECQKLSAVQLIGENNQLRAELEKANALNHRWNRAASAHGPCGSEFHNEPERVFERVLETRTSLMETVKRRGAELAALKASAGAWIAVEAQAPPKDGTRILVLNDRGAFAVEWRTVYFEGWWCQDGKHDDRPLRGSAPTHWMPIPAIEVAMKGDN